MANIDYLLSDINNINGIGSKTAKLLRRKNITTIFDLLWNLPRDFVDRTKTYKISELEIGKVQTFNVIVKNLLCCRNIFFKYKCLKWRDG